MAIGRRGTDPGRARRLGEGEAGRALLRDQLERGADQRLPQVAVVVTAVSPNVLRAWTSSCKKHLHNSEPAVDLILAVTTDTQMPASVEIVSAMGGLGKIEQLPSWRRISARCGTDSTRA